MFSSRSSPHRLTPEQAHTRTGDGTAVLLDVRENAEWQTGHAPGALHLPLGRLEDGEALPPEAQDRPVVTVCRSGRRSQRAAELLAARGVACTDVVGGMEAWAEAGLLVTGGPAA